MWYRSLLIVLSACLLSLATLVLPAAAAKGPLTYDQIRNTGQAGLCPTVSENAARGRIEVPADGVIKLTEVCFQPVQIEVEEEKRSGEKEFMKAKPIMLYAATIGPVKAEVRPADGHLKFQVTDGLASQPVTVQMPRRELVPLLFSVKQLTAQAQDAEMAITSSTDFEGEYLVPGYRSSLFLDPRGRGTATGYDSAVGLQAAADEFEASRKSDELFTGQMSLRIARIDASTGEIAGSFVSEQPSSDEQGTMEVRNVRIQGLFYARLA